jgi:hypothetical protein
MKNIITFFLFSILCSFTVFSQKKPTGSKIFWVPPAKPKKPTPPPQKSWFVSWELTVKGNGSEKGDADDGSEVTWSIDRKYTGKVELNFSSPGYLPEMNAEQIKKALMEGNITDWRHMKPVKTGGPIDYQLTTNSIPIHVFIKDKRKMLVKDRGEGDSFENTTTTEEWNADYDGFTQNQARLQTIAKSSYSHYSVWLPVSPFDDILEPAKLFLSTTVSIERSKYGYGDLPTSETEKKPDQHLHINDAHIPQLNGILEKDALIHPYTDLPYEEKNGVFEFDSGENLITKPLFDFIPESKTNVKVRIVFHFAQKAHPE